MVEERLRRRPNSRRSVQELVYALAPLTTRLVAEAHGDQVIQPNPPGERNVHLFANRLHAVSPRLADAITVVHEVEIGARKGDDSLVARERDKYKVYKPVVEDLKEVVAINPRLQDYTHAQSERVAKDVVNFYRLVLENYNREFKPISKRLYTAADVVARLKDQTDFKLSPLMETVLEQTDTKKVKLEEDEIARFGGVMLDEIKNKFRRRQVPALRLFSEPDLYGTKSFRGGSIEKKHDIGDKTVDKYKYMVVSKNGDEREDERESVTISVKRGGQPISIETKYREFEGEKLKTETNTQTAYQRGLGIIRDSKP